jgi:hypothetical protein
MSEPSAHIAESSGTKVDALVAQFMEERRAAEAKVPAANPLTSRRNLAVVLSLICAAAWLAPYPAAPSRTEIAPALVDASARMNVFLAAQRVRVYESARHRLPSRLADAGVADTTLDYVQDGGRFTITASLASVVVTYDSAAPADSLLRNAETVIDGLSR